jgi:hypothetical protein
MLAQRSGSRSRRAVPDNFFAGRARRTRVVIPIGLAHPWSDGAPSQLADRGETDFSLEIRRSAAGVIPECARCATRTCCGSNPPFPCHTARAARQRQQLPGSFFSPENVTERTFVFKIGLNIAPPMWPFPRKLSIAAMSEALPRQEVLRRGRIAILDDEIPEMLPDLSGHGLSVTHNHPPRPIPEVTSSQKKTITAKITLFSE